MTAPSPVPLKIVIVGDGGVGKSSITMAVLSRDFSEEYDPTVEDSYQRNVNVDGVEYAVEIVDTAGQEEYRGLWQEGVAREGDGFILTYAIDSQDSFDILPDFMHVIRKVKSPDDVPSTAMTPENTPFPFMVVGNKCDKPPSERVVSAQQGLAFSRAAGGLFYEVSAKQRVNIDAFFTTLIRAVARSKALHQEHVRRCRGVDDGLFNGNVGFIERQGGGASITPRGSISTASGVRYGENAEDEKARALAARKRNPSLAMDRRRSLSVGGLGRDPDDLHAKEGKGCGCVIC